MKKIMMMAMLMGSFSAFAQQDGEVDMDQIQQQPPRDTQRQVERAAQSDAKKLESNETVPDQPVKQPADTTAVRRSNPKK